MIAGRPATVRALLPPEAIPVALRPARPAGRIRLQTILTEFAAAQTLVAADKQVAAAARVATTFLRNHEIRAADEITPTTIQNYLAQITAAGRSPKTVANHRGYLSVFCAYLRSRGLLTGQPCRDVRLARPARRPARFLEPQEIHDVLTLARKHGIYVEVCLALATGLRLGELIRLQWRDVDVRRKILLVRISKSRRPRVVPLCRPAIAALAEQREMTGRLQQVFPARQTWRGGWRWIDRPRASNWWRRALRPIQRAIPRFVELDGSSTGRAWHLLRHTFASRLAQAGVSLYKIAQWLGHSDVRITQTYAHLQGRYDPAIEAAMNFRPPAKLGRALRGLAAVALAAVTTLEVLYNELSRLRTENDRLTSATGVTPKKETVPWSIHASPAVSFISWPSAYSWR